MRQSPQFVSLSNEYINPNISKSSSLIQPKNAINEELYR